MAETQKLPDKMSELIRVALEDIEKCERDPRYKIDMDTWHGPLVTSPLTCAVCAAGSVMAKRLGADPSRHLFPYSFSDADTQNKLSAINALRAGEIDVAAMHLGIDVAESVHGFRHVTDHNYCPTDFKQDMRELAEYLEGRGL